MDGAKYPEGVKFRDQLGMTVLTKACRAISYNVDEEIAAPDLCTENTSRICRFVIQDYPKEFLSKHLGDADPSLLPCTSMESAMGSRSCHRYVGNAPRSYECEGQEISPETKR